LANQSKENNDQRQHSREYWPSDTKLCYFHYTFPTSSESYAAGQVLVPLLLEQLCSLEQLLQRFWRQRLVPLSRSLLTENPMHLVQQLAFLQ
jgi:hypothetical protein